MLECCLCHRPLTPQECTDHERANRLVTVQMLRRWGFSTIDMLPVCDACVQSRSMEEFMDLMEPLLTRKEDAH